MKAEELRIGNWVSMVYQSMISPIQVSFINDTTTEPLVNGLPIYEFEPIPLTKGWLLRFGFDIHAGYLYYDNSNHLMGHMEREENHWILENGDREIASFKYVHQLQNLYFALTGEELELKEHTPN